MHLSEERLNSHPCLTAAEFDAVINNGAPELQASADKKLKEFQKTKWDELYVIKCDALIHKAYMAAEKDAAKKINKGVPFIRLYHRQMDKLKREEGLL